MTIYATRLVDRGSSQAIRNPRASTVLTKTHWTAPRFTHGASISAHTLLAFVLPRATREAALGDVEDITIGMLAAIQALRRATGKRDAAVDALPIHGAHQARQIARIITTASITDLARKVTQAVGQVDDVIVELESERQPDGQMITPFRRTPS
jgi:hypothetical protein